MEESDLAEAHAIINDAFGTFMNVPNKETFWADVQFAHTRWRALPEGAFICELDGRIAGSNFATRWGSFGFFGPLSVRPELWDQGLGKYLMTPIMECFDQWGVTHAGLFTFAHSPKHGGLYRKFGFWPRYLTAIMGRKVGERTRAKYSRYSEGSEDERVRWQRQAREITNAIYPGLDVSIEVESVYTQKLGDTILVLEGGDVSAFAVCHIGPGTEAGPGKCYMKFAAARAGSGAKARLRALLDAVHEFAVDSALKFIEGGVNMARREAFQTMQEKGFRVMHQGVAMQRNDEAAYNRSDVYVIDDWR